MARFDHHPDCSRIRLELGDVAQQCADPGAAVVDPAHLDHPLVGPTQGHEVELLGPIDANAQHQASFPTGTRVEETRRRADGPVLWGRHPPGRQASAVSPPRRCLL
jgi:hypothetical protein